MNTAVTGVLLAILVIIAGLWYFVFRDMGETPEPDDNVWFYKIEEFDIEFISIKTEETEQGLLQESGRRLVFRRGTAAAGGPGPLGRRGRWC